MTLDRSFWANQNPDALDALGDDPNTVYSEIIGLVFAMNAEVQHPVPERCLVSPVTGGLNSDLLKRLKKWLEKLREKLPEIAKSLGVKSYAIAVGGPPSVSVTLTFKVKQ